ncbi:hypothetical protein SNEBB_004611 [Seison nebaliae]|nr:hypothetical protein SNEBB_004611 [Seison nebaliae]
MYTCSVESCRVKECETAYYIPDFITREEEDYLLRNIENTPKTKWVQLSNRRLQNWGGRVGGKFTLQESIPKWLQDYVDKVKCFNIFPSKQEPNHILLNEYKPNEGIMPHYDGPFYHPVVMTISLGESTFLRFYRYNNDSENRKQLKFEFAFHLEPRSLLILKDDLYNEYLHGIDENINEELLIEKVLNVKGKNDETLSIKRSNTRVSLTIRHVANMKNVNNILRKLYNFRSTYLILLKRNVASYDETDASQFLQSMKDKRIFGGTQEEIREKEEEMADKNSEMKDEESVTIGFMFLLQATPTSSAALENQDEASAFLKLRKRLFGGTKEEAREKKEEMGDNQRELAEETAEDRTENAEESRSGLGAKIMKVLG